MAEAAGRRVSFEFEGNQVRLIGRADPSGGKADVYLDGVKQLCGIDFWCPQARDQQVLCYKNGLAQGKHTLKIVALGHEESLRERHAGVRRCRAVVGRPRRSRFGRGGRPGRSATSDLRLLKRKDYVDSQGHAWRPATEYVMRLAASGRSGAHRLLDRAEDQGRGQHARTPELYRYGVHGKDFTAYFTVDPQIDVSRADQALPGGRPSDARQTRHVD